MDQSEFWNDYQHLQREVNHLRVSEARLKSLVTLYKLTLKSSDQLVIIFDRAGVVSEINRSGLKYLDMPKNRVVGRECAELFQHPKSAALGQRLSEVLQSKKTVSFKWELQRLIGATLDFKIKLVAVIDELDSCVGALLVAEEISELNDLKSEIISLKEECERLRAENENPSE
jgi:PAS domain S-box-containing protein